MKPVVGETNSTNKNFLCLKERDHSKSKRQGGNSPDLNKERGEVGHLFNPGASILGIYRWDPGRHSVKNKNENEKCGKSNFHAFRPGRSSPRAAGGGKPPLLAVREG